ncbi:hypothetical protein HJC23_003645 [Cyclotella cryptica]|uniref:Alpha-ketoglutarate-dependent dioxygenase AlkB-like domain-containing protein n=1 Tax=Cyclotella cryptica TaxID=29204 RepID=A0ABD3QIU2_9STRA|eukprot:CCRYP_004931-RA/>CCRYP_004931-RA protein AED:0.43 eAED:0.43 QI:0/-1/0/1/-1/1/1/0/312
MSILYPSITKEALNVGKRCSAIRLTVISSRAMASFSAAANHASIQPDPSHVNLRHAPPSFDVTSAVVFPNFITEEEGKSFIKEVSKRMKRRRFEQGHWDSVIVGYREVELTIPEDASCESAISNAGVEDTPLFVEAIQRTRQHLEARHFSSNNTFSSPERGVKWIPCHVIDLKEEGRLDAHVDSVKFSGQIVAGLSLLSDSIMRLKPCSDEWKSEDDEGRNTHASEQTCNGKDAVFQGHVDLYLPKRSLYILSGMSRFSYTHELLPSGSTFEFMADSEVLSRGSSSGRSINVDRSRRLSIIFRDELRLNVPK